MNCESFDKDIQITFAKYEPVLGVTVKLLSVKDRHSPQPPYDWIDVMVEIAPVVQNPEWKAVTWHYGGLISSTISPVPIGIRPIDKDKLIGACTAAKKLPVGFDVASANCDLVWPVYYKALEPIYSFYNEEVCFRVGAYTGKLIEE